MWSLNELNRVQHQHKDMKNVSNDRLYLRGHAQREAAFLPRLSHHGNDDGLNCAPYVYT